MSSKPRIPTVKLTGSGDEMPVIAFGSGSKHRIKKWEDPDMGMEVADEGLVEILVTAIQSGFNHIDTAEGYTTRLEVGQALKRAGVDRSKIWITDKYNPGWVFSAGAIDHEGVVPANTPSGPYESLQKGLKIMGLDYVDAFLIHGPYFTPETSGITVEEAWDQMERLKREGLARNIGVSNFDTPLLERIYNYGTFKPVIDQVEYHLYLQMPELRKFCDDHGILMEGFAPLTPLSKAKVGDGKPLEPVIKELAKKYNCDANQLILKWVMDSGVVPITTSSNLDRIKNTLKLLDINISPEDYELLKTTGEKYTYRCWFNNYYDGEFKI